MSLPPADRRLVSALELSEAILQASRAADAADAADAAHAANVAHVGTLDAQRLALLKSYASSGGGGKGADRELLNRIAAINDRAIGELEHCKRRCGRKMDMAAAGRRALGAYSATGGKAWRNPF